MGRCSVGKLHDKTAIVTGSGRGIGRAIACKLAHEGANVVVNDLDQQSADQTADHIRDDAGRAAVVIGDVTEPSFADRLVQVAIENFGDVHIIVNNAGYVWNGAIHKHSDEQWAAMFDIHSTSPFRVTRSFVRHVKSVEVPQEDAPDRRLIYISSTSAVYGAALQASYASAKAAVIGLTRSLAWELGRYNITVNAVAFGHIETRLTGSRTTGENSIEIMGRTLPVGLEDQERSLRQRLSPLGRPGTVEEAAGAVAILCFPESTYITGQVLLCNGGLPM